MTENDDEIDFSMLMASSVHDIKNSLGMLIHTLEEMASKSDPNDEAEQRTFATLRGESSRINNGLISLLGIYNLENKRLAVKADEIYLEDFIEEQIAAQQLLFDVNHVKVEIDCDPDLAGFFDENLIGGVITNILVNDVRYTQDTIWIKAYNEDGYVVIELMDNGKGYPEEILQNTEEQAIDFISGSTKLGLYFAQEIAKLHKCGDKTGYIKLSNTDTGGRFQIFLP